MNDHEKSEKANGNETKIMFLSTIIETTMMRILMRTLMTDYEYDDDDHDEFIRRSVSVGDLPILTICFLSDSVFTLVCASGLESDTQAQPVIRGSPHILSRTSNPSSWTFTDRASPGTKCILSNRVCISLRRK